MSARPAIVLIFAAPFVVANGDPEGTSASVPDTWESLELNGPALSTDRNERRCEDTYETVMQERGESLLQRENASEERTYFIRTVDYDVGGCDFMLTGAGIQPLPPRPGTDAPLFQRLR